MKENWKKKWRAPLVEAVVEEGLVDGQPDPSEADHIHDVVAQVVEDVVLRQVGHHLEQPKRQTIASSVTELSPQLFTWSRRMTSP